MLKAIFRPLESWPKKLTPVSSRRYSPFKSSYGDTLVLLERELSAIDARNVVIQAQFTLGQIRNDGWPRGTAKPSGPAVILNFTKGRDTISMPCDTFHDYEDNLRAIALSLEALRKIDRYGVTTGSEQYQGFKALPSANDSSIAKEKATEFFAVHLGISRSEVSKRDVTEMFRALAKKLHPDMSTEGAALFHELQAHRKVLEG